MRIPREALGDSAPEPDVRDEGASAEPASDGAAARPEPDVERLLERVEQPSPAAELAPPALRTARVLRVLGGTVEIAWRGRHEPVRAVLAEGVDPDLVRRSVDDGSAVLVEQAPGDAPVVVGVVQTRLPSAVELRASTVTIDAEREVLLRAGGRAALRIREDGDVELVGSRILTMSRGLFRIVGRVLRLN